MTQIIEIEQAIVKEITVDSEGHGFITGRGLARLLGINATAFTAGKKMPSKIREIVTEHGFEPDGLAQTGFPDLLLSPIAFYYAVDAQKTSEQARQVLKVLGAVGSRVWMQKVTGWVPPVPPNGSAAIAPQTAVEQMSVIDLIFDGMSGRTDIEPNIIELARLSAVQNQLPQMSPAVEAAKRMLSNHTVQEESFYSPTELGKLISHQLGLSKVPSARRVNQALQNIGLQVSLTTANGKKSWHLTEEGKQFGRRQLDSASRSSKAFTLLFW